MSTGNGGNRENAGFASIRDVALAGIVMMIATGAESLKAGKGAGDMPAVAAAGSMIAVGLARLQSYIATDQSVEPIGLNMIGHAMAANPKTPNEGVFGELLIAIGLIYSDLLVAKSVPVLVERLETLEKRIAEALTRYQADQVAKQAGPDLELDQ